MSLLIGGGDPMTNKQERELKENETQKETGTLGSSYDFINGI